MSICAVLVSPPLMPPLMGPSWFFWGLVVKMATDKCRFRRIMATVWPRPGSRCRACHTLSSTETKFFKVRQLPLVNLVYYLTCPILFVTPRRFPPPTQSNCPHTPQDSTYPRYYIEVGLSHGYMCTCNMPMEGGPGSEEAK